jgi:hypothetical protein
MMKRQHVVALIAVTLLLVVAGFALNRQSTAAAPANIEVGTALGLTATEFVGREDQNGANFIAYGYLTYVHGLTDTLLFSSTNPLLNNETTARLTYYATASLTARSVISSVFTVNSIGTVIYYFNQTPNGDFSNPNSFASGVPIVTGTVRYQDILNVQAPNLGIATGTGEFTQVGIAPFTVGGQTFQLGRVGIQERIFTTGEGTRTDPITPKSFVVQAGNAFVTGLPTQQTFTPFIAR